MHRHILFCVLVSLFPALSSAGVNPKNGDFYITYNILSGCDEFNRTYNSKATDRGWFGFGWGSPFETRLLILSDDSAAVSENGLGATSYYGRQKNGAITHVIEKIITDIRADTKMDAYEVTELRQQLSDKDKRIEKVKGYGISKQMTDGTVLVSDQCDDGRLQKQGNSYVRTSCNGDKDYFNSHGWLVKHEETSGRTLNATYSDSWYPKEIRSSTGCVAKLEWKSEGLIQSAIAEHEGKSETHSFRYDAAGNLTLDNAIGGNYYKYGYDTNHNMTEIGYVDGSKQKMTYDKNSLATSETESETLSGGKKYTYEYQTDPNGDYTTKITSMDKNGGNKVSWDYKYNKGGDLIRKTDKQGHWIEFEYHPVYKKVTHVREAESEKKFEYDTQGQLSHVTDMVSGQQVWLKYDSNAHIVALTGKDNVKAAKKVLHFKYGVLGKPIEISIVGVGNIIVTYDDDGEIKSVDSDKGARMALLVTQAFQSLLSLVKTSGADISL